MFPKEPMLTISEFALELGGSYHSARRKVLRHGGYRVIGDETNLNYETRRVPRSVADEIIRKSTKPKKGGR